MHGLSRYKPVKKMLNSSIKTNYLCLGYCLIKRYKKMEADVLKFSGELESNMAL
jgi:hypothetical protein